MFPLSFFGCLDWSQCSSCSQAVVWRQTGRAHTLMFQGPELDDDLRESGYIGLHFLRPSVTSDTKQKSRSGQWFEGGVEGPHTCFPIVHWGFLKSIPIVFQCTISICFVRTDSVPTSQSELKNRFRWEKRLYTKSGCPWSSTSRYHITWMSENLHRHIKLLWINLPQLTFSPCLVNVFDSIQAMC